MGDRKPQRQLEADDFLFDRLKNLDLQGVLQALENGANPNAVDMTSKRPSSALDTLMISGALSPTNEKNDETEETIIAIANALFGHGGKVSDTYDDHILFFPIAQGRAKLTELLIENGANPRAKTDGQTPMEWAVHYNHPKIMDVLAAHGIPKVDSSKTLVIRLIRAAQNSDTKEIVRMRREGNIDVNAKDDRDQTALIVALRTPIYEDKQYRTIKLLLELGADPNLTGESMFSGLEGIPIHLAVAMNTHTLNEPRGDSKRLATLVIENILKHGGKVAHRDSRGRTALHIAAEHDNLAAAQILVQNGTTIMPRDNSGKTPLDYAESGGMIKFLKSRGAKENR
ncbi:MAG: ankyrin repeat domain-containing protein [Nitrospira sp.]|nr:ankyrin repeat domain-containing protein [Nitrospira sp.]